MAMVEPPIIKMPTIHSDHFAEFLLKEKYLLTALEFHYELLERGTSCGILRDFFSNPENFDHFESAQVQIPSYCTFPSLPTNFQALV